MINFTVITVQLSSTSVSSKLHLNVLHSAELQLAKTATVNRVADYSSKSSGFESLT